MIEERERQAADEHFLVIMKSRHTGSLDEVDPMLMGRMMLQAKLCAQKKGLKDGYRIVVDRSKN